MASPDLQITSPHNPRVGWLRSLQTPKGRANARAFLIEGPHLVEEALRAHLTPSLVLYDPAALANSPLLSAVRSLAETGAEVLATTPAVIDRVAEAQTPQGIVAAMPLDAVQPEKLKAGRRGRLRPIVLVLDDLRDPGNVGTILRSALAADVDCALLTPNCVDAYNPKVVRAAAGAHFHLPVYDNQSWEQIAATMHGAPHMQQVVVADAAADADYFDLDLTQRTGLIIGNEAHGPSAVAKKLATKQVRIPMYNGVESLNAAIAASVLLFESVRQRQTKRSDT